MKLVSIIFHEAISFEQDQITSAPSSKYDISISKDQQWVIVSPLKGDSLNRTKTPISNVKYVKYVEEDVVSGRKEHASGRVESKKIDD